MDIKDDFIDPCDKIEQKMFKDFKSSLPEIELLSEENQHPRSEPKEQPERKMNNGTYISQVYCSSYNNVNGQPHQECYQAQSIKQMNEGHNISEAREAYKNSDGVMKSAYQRGLDEKGARFIKEKILRPENIHNIKSLRELRKMKLMDSTRNIMPIHKNVVSKELQSFEWIR